MNSGSRAYLSATLALALFGLQFAVIRMLPWELAVRMALPATIALAPGALWVYRRHLGVWVIYVGLAANLAAIVANGGLMPIERATVVAAIGEERAARYQAGGWIQGSKDVLVAPGAGQLVALGDSIVIDLGDGGLVASPGDLVVWAGIVILAAEASLAWQRGGQRTRAPGMEGAQPSPQGGEGGAATSP